MAEVSLKDVKKSYGKVDVIKGVDIDIEDGEFVVFVGPSGCGKSTLLRMIAGLEEVTSGDLFIGGELSNTLTPKQRNIAMVFQSYALYPQMTVFQNMAFSLEQRRMPKRQIRETVLQAARILDLEALVDRKPGALSGGQRQRVAMGRAIVRSPAIYLMDEPLSNLDAKLRVQMRAELKLLRSRLGVTTLYVTHDQVEAMTLGDRVAVLAPCTDAAQSNLQQVDSPQTLYLKPCNMFVAGFIGSPAMNFFYADIVGSGEGLTATIAGMDTRLPLTPANAPGFAALGAYAGRRVVLGVRPEFFSFAPEPRADEAVMSVDVLVSELVGPDAFLHFDLPTPEVSLAAMAALDDTRDTGHPTSRYTARVGSERLSRPSGRMDLAIDVPRLHFFDGETTLRIG